MNNDRGKSLQIPKSIALTEGYIYVASLYSVTKQISMGMLNISLRMK